MAQDAAVARVCDGFSPWPALKSVSGLI